MKDTLKLSELKQLNVAEGKENKINVIRLVAVSGRRIGHF